MYNTFDFWAAVEKKRWYQLYNMHMQHTTKI